MIMMVDDKSPASLPGFYFCTDGLQIREWRLKNQKPLPPRSSEITVPTMILISSQTEKFST